MSGKTPVWRRYLRLFGPDPAADVKDELRFHLEAKLEDLVAQGWRPEAARLEAERQFGDLQAVQAAGVQLALEAEQTRRRQDRSESWGQDFRYALRTLRRDRVFATVTILVLALGVAANVAVFSVVNTVLLRPLPFPDAERLTWFQGGKALPANLVKAAGLSAVTYTVSAYEEFQRNNRSFQSVTSYNPFFGNSEYTLTGHGDPQPVAGVMVAENFFQTLAIQPAQGRVFAKEECRKGGGRALLLSNRFWRHQFASDPAVVGQTIALNKKSFLVVGILPPSFDFGSVFSPGFQVDVYVPAVMDELRNWGNTLAVVGRLRPGVSLAQAQTEADVLFPQLKAANKDWEMDYSSNITSLKEFVSGTLRRSLIVLWCAVGLILLICCVNLSSLLLARTVARSKEFALRAALGAGRGRIFRQLFTESFVLASAGSLLGLAIAFLITAYLAKQDSIALPLLNFVKIDAFALAWTLLIAIVTTLLFGCIAGLKLASGSVQESLKDSSAGISSGRKHETLRATLVISEVALACVLLIGAGLLLRSFLAVIDVDLGFQPSQAAVMKIVYDDGNNRGKRSAILQEILRKVSTIPGVETAGVADMLPLGRNRSWAFAVKGKVYPPGIPGEVGLTRIVTPSYFRAMGMHLRAGRDFSWRDSASTPAVMIVNQAAARLFWPGLDPIGQSAFTNGAKEETHVVGILSNVREESVEAQPEPEIYLPVMQADPEGAELVVKTLLPPPALASSILKALRSLNPAQPASELIPLQQIVDRAVSPRRFFVMLVASFSLLGLSLASLGIFGVIAYSVSRQTKEIGIRMALGASAPQVRRAVMARALRLALAGVAAGTLASLVVSRWISSLLFATQPTDPFTFGVIILLLLTIALLAGYIPARPASRIDPILALRVS